MSALTKLFVVLLVICSLVLVAADVVFIRRVEDFRKLFQDADGKRKLAEAQRGEAQAAVDASDAKVTAINYLWSATVENVKDKLAKAQGDAKGLAVQLADLNKQISITGSQLTQALETQKESQIAQNNQAKEITEKRDALDKLRQEAGDLNQQLAAKLKEVDLYSGQVKNLQETIINMRAQITKLNQMIANQVTAAPGPGAMYPTGGSGGGAPNESNARAAVNPTVGVPPISGVIRQVQNVNDIWYATISVGSSDHVEKGMEFKVTDAAGNFIGVLKVEQVEPNEAFGRLQGPRVQETRREMRVSTTI